MAVVAGTASPDGLMLRADSGLISAASSCFDEQAQLPFQIRCRCRLWFVGGCRLLAGAAELAARQPVELLDHLRIRLDGIDCRHDSEEENADRNSGSENKQSLQVDSGFLDPERSVFDIFCVRASTSTLGA